MELCTDPEYMPWMYCELSYSISMTEVAVLFWWEMLDRPRDRSIHAMCKSHLPRNRHTFEDCDWGSKVGRDEAEEGLPFHISIVFVGPA